MKLTVNGATHEIAVAGHERLVTVIRERLQLTGTKLACGRGECGACTVLLDDGSGGGAVGVYSCLTLAAACDGSSITTIEGIGSANAPHPLQEAFVEHDALQCGFCTPGQVLAALALLRRHPRPTAADVRREMAGNLCRCGAYPRIVDAVLAAAERMDA